MVCALSYQEWLNAIRRIRPPPVPHTRASGRFTFLKEPIHPAAVANCRECRRDEQHRLTLRLSMAVYARSWNRADPHCPTSDDATLRSSSMQLHILFANARDDSRDLLGHSAFSHHISLAYLCMPHWLQARAASQIYYFSSGKITDSFGVSSSSRGVLLLLLLILGVGAGSVELVG